MSIVPLQQFEEDLAEYLAEKEDREAYERLNAPTSIVVRFGAMKMVAELPYDGETKPGCGSKLVCRTQRGTEVCEMLTSTCPNAGCSKSVTRREMLEYIDNSGGRDYPFFESKAGGGVRGRVLRIATAEDLARQQGLEQSKHSIKMGARKDAEELGLNLRIVDAEPILGGEILTVFYMSEDRVDFRALVERLADRHGTRIDMRQVGARDEARLTADYERCGQHCCCKGFLKVLKPVSMRSAKVQKATLDPLKISGRCGRLMCCLRYEDQTYSELRKRLPNRKKRVGTPDGDGIVISTQILTQLALVRLDEGKDVAIAVEDLTDPEHAVAPERGERPERGGRGGRGAATGRGERGRRDGDRPRSGSGAGPRDSKEASDSGGGARGAPSAGPEGSTGTEKPKRKRRRRPADRPEGQAGGGSVEVASGGATDTAGTAGGNAPENTGTGTDEAKPKRRRRRRRGGAGGAASGSTGGPTGGSTGGEAQGASNAGGEGGEKLGGDAGRSDPNPGGDVGGESGPRKRRRRRRRPGGGAGGDSGGKPGGDSGGGGAP